MPQKSVTFEKTIFAGPSTPEADEAWGNDISPPGDGFVLIPDPSAYDLPPGQPMDSDSPNAKGEVYDISVFHQLHCLRHVRTFLFTLKAGMDYNSTAETYDRMLRHQEEHVYHCFDYIRQALMICLRMLQPHELYRAQGFPAGYIIDKGADGKRFTKTEQVHMCGNSVSPPPMAALARANDPWRLAERKSQAA